VLITPILSLQQPGKVAQGLSLKVPHPKKPSVLGQVEPFVILALSQLSTSILVTLMAIIKALTIVAKKK